MEERNGQPHAQPTPVEHDAHASARELLARAARDYASGQPWPDGVIARYLTVSGALVDISHDMHYLTDTEPNTTIARCKGCDAQHDEQWGPYAYRSNNGSSGADAEVGKWAQAHASECRALPQPEATQ